jgi:hypothetical protein
VRIERRRPSTACRLASVVSRDQAYSLGCTMLAILVGCSIINRLMVDCGIHDHSLLLIHSFARV